MYAGGNQYCANAAPLQLAREIAGMAAAHDRAGRNAEAIFLYRQATPFLDRHLLREPRDSDVRQKLAQVKNRADFLDQKLHSDFSSGQLQQQKLQQQHVQQVRKPSGSGVDVSHFPDAPVSRPNLVGGSVRMQSSPALHSGLSASVPASLSRVTGTQQQRQQQVQQQQQRPNIVSTKGYGTVVAVSEHEHQPPQQQRRQSDPNQAPPFRGSFSVPALQPQPPKEQLLPSGVYGISPQAQRPLQSAAVESSVPGGMGAAAGGGGAHGLHKPLPRISVAGMPLPGGVRNPTIMPNDRFAAAAGGYKPINLPPQGGIAAKSPKNPYGTVVHVAGGGSADPVKLSEAELARLNQQRLAQFKASPYGQAIMADPSYQEEETSKQNTRTVIRVHDFKKEIDLMKKIGKGAYGSVYKCRHIPTATIAAGKSRKIENSKDMEEIELELAVMRECDSPYIVSFMGTALQTRPGKHSSDKPQKLFWIFMEFCEFGSLRGVLHKRKCAFTEAQTAYTVRNCLLGIQYMHDLRMMHRDIKCDNLLLTSGGEPKIADFGISGQLEDTMAKKNTMIGTPYYLAPEVVDINGEGYSAKCDIWSLGISTIELCELNPPRFDQPAMRVLYSIPNADPPTLTKEPERWSSELHDFIACMLVKDSDARPWAKDLLEHPFLHKADKYAMKELVADLIAHSEEKQSTERKQAAAAAAAASLIPKPQAAPSREKSPRSSDYEDDSDLFNEDDERYSPSVSADELGLPPGGRGHARKPSAGGKDMLRDTFVPKPSPPRSPQPPRTSRGGSTGSVPSREVRLTTPASSAATYSGATGQTAAQRANNNSGSNELTREIVQIIQTGDPRAFKHVLSSITAANIFILRNPVFVDSGTQRTPLQLAFEIRNRTEIIRLILRHFHKLRVDVNERNSAGNTMLLELMSSTTFEPSDLVLLLKFKACASQIHAVNAHGDTALHYFCRNVRSTAAPYFAQSLSILLKAIKKAVQARNSSDETPLHWAVLNADPGVAATVSKFLLKKKADPNAMNVQGEAPIHSAVRMDRESLVIALVERGADVTLRTRDGSSTEDLAVANNNASLANCIRFLQRQH